MTKLSNMNEDAKKLYLWNYDFVRLIALSLVFLQHFYVECVRAGSEIPLFITQLISGKVNMGTIGSALFFFYLDLFYGYITVMIKH